MWASGKKVAAGFTSRLKATFFGGGTVPTATWTKMEFKGVAYDNDSEVDIVTTYRWNVAATGVYRITAMATIVGMPSTDGMGFVCKIYKNGSSAEHGTNGVRGGGGAGLVTSIHTTCLELTAGDYIEVFAHQDTGVDKGISSQANYMTAERIG